MPTIVVAGGGGWWWWRVVSEDQFVGLTGAVCPAAPPQSDTNTVPVTISSLHSLQTTPTTVVDRQQLWGGKFSFVGQVSYRGESSRQSAAVIIKL